MGCINSVNKEGEDVRDYKSKFFGESKDKKFFWVKYINPDTKEERLDINIKEIFSYQRMYSELLEMKKLFGTKMCGIPSDKEWDKFTNYVQDSLDILHGLVNTDSSNQIIMKLNINY